jgi:dihydrolipoamide dehydrogenase
MADATPSETSFDVVVIGAGPGGYIAAIRAAQLGLKAACVEQVEALGGTCLRVGCIPSKALLESSERFAETAHVLAKHGVNVEGVSLDLPTMMKRKDGIVRQLTRGIAGLFKKHGVTRLHGHGRLDGKDGELFRVQVTPTDEGGEAATVTCRHVILATGSVEATLPGIEMDWDRIGSSTQALSYPDVPEHLVVIGAGAIGLELGSVWARLGSKVTVLEYAKRILVASDAEVAKLAQRAFKKQGLSFELGARVTGARVEGKGKKTRCVVEVDGKDPITCDRVLVAVGRKPNTDNLGLDTVGLQTDERGRVTVDGHRQTAVPGIWGIGDLVPGPMLAHKAEEEGAAVAEHIATGWSHVDYDSIPNVVYTEPEVASVGKTEDELKEAGVDYKAGSYPYMANGRAKALLHTDGIVKVLADAQTDRILGVHIVGARAGDLIAECAVAMGFGASAEDLGRSNHAHPTLAEIVKHAALQVSGSSPAI